MKVDRNNNDKQTVIIEFPVPIKQCGERMIALEVGDANLPEMLTVDFVEHLQRQVGTRKTRKIIERLQLEAFKAVLWDMVQCDLCRELPKNPVTPDWDKVKV